MSPPSVPFSPPPPVDSSAIDSRFILGVPVALLASKHRKQGYRVETLTLNAPGSFSVSGVSFWGATISLLVVSRAESKLFYARYVGGLNRRKASKLGKACVVS